MSGHSKWKNIMHKKEKSDAQKASVFTKIGREITQAVKEGGPDPASNSKLKDIIAKATVAKQSADVHTATLTQMMAAQYLARY